MYALASRGVHINKVLSQTFTVVGLMWLITAAVSMMSLSLNLSGWVYLGLFLVNFAMIFVISKFKNSSLGLVGLGIFAIIDGVVLGPMLNRFLSMENGVTLISMAALCTAGATLGCAAYAISSKRDFSRMSGFLLAGLIVVIVASIANIFIQATMFSLIISCVSALLFVAWMLYDISRVVNGQEDNYIMASLGIFLDMFNLFVNLLNILGILNSDD